MNLTLNALNKVKDTCGKLTALESLFAAENEMELFADIQSLNAQLSTTYRLMDEVTDALKYLKVNGYSDEWFDSINKDGSLEGLVSFDMPKFFDGPAGRAQACQEGFFETLRNWVMAALKFIASIANKIYDFFMKICEFFDERSWTDSIRKRIDQFEKKVANDKVVEYLNQRSYRFEGYYDTNSITTYVNNIKALVDAVIPAIEMDDAFVSSVATSPDRIDTQAVRAAVISNLQKALNDKGIPFDNISSGFVLRHDPMGTNFVDIIGVRSGTEFQKTTKDVTGVDGLREMMADAVAKFSLMANALRNSLAATLKALKASKAKADKAIRDINAQKNGTPEDLRDYTMDSQAAQCGISILIPVGKFCHILKAVRNYNESLFAALIKDIDKIPKA